MDKIIEILNSIEELIDAIGGVSAALFMLLFVISEWMAFSKKVRANGIVDAIRNWFKKDSSQQNYPIHRNSRGRIW